MPGAAAYLLFHALAIIDEAAIPDPGQVLHDQLGSLGLPGSRLSADLYHHFSP
jgi:hypothetical protein